MASKRAASPTLAINIRLQPKQARVLALLEATGNCPVWIGAGGAKGGGKSKTIRSVALLLALKYGDRYPGMVVTIVRRVSRDLADNHIEPLKRDYPDLMRECWRGDDSQIVLPNGAIIAFRYAENEADVTRKFLGGYESMFILVDEAQQFSEGELNNIKSAARWTESRGGGVPKGFSKIALFFNPGGIGSGFIRRIFWLRQYIGKERADHYVFVHVFGFDNYEWFRGQVDISENQFYGSPDGTMPPMIERCGLGDQDTAAAREDATTCCRFHTFIEFTSEGQKYNAFPPAMRPGYLLGSFDHFAGQYFAGVWDESKVVITAVVAERIVRTWWTHWIAQDWGFTDHAATTWAATGKMAPVDFEEVFGVRPEFGIDVVVVKREYVVAQVGETEYAQGVADRTMDWEKRVIKDAFLSKDAWNVRGSQNTVADLIGPVFRRNGLPQVEQADQDREGGWRLIWNCLKQTCSMRSVSPAYTPGIPMLLVSAECVELISAMPLLISDPKKPNDVLKMTTITEDISDSLRYLLKSKLSPKTEAPREVRFAEATRGMVHPNQVAMAARLFADRESRRTRAAQPRWRG